MDSEDNPMEDIEILTAEEEVKKTQERLKKLREDRLFQLKCKFGNPLAERVYEWEQKNERKIDE